MTAHKIKPTNLERWCSQQQQALAHGGSARTQRQIEQGKKTARERIDLLLDNDSFQETDQLALSPFLSSSHYSDGVITGFGTVNDRQVALYAQDFTIRGGSLGKQHAQKIIKIMDMAAKIGCPIIGIIDSGGARIEEGIHALAGYGEIFMRNVKYSGIIPQISVVVGPCAGGAVYSPALTDFILTTESISQLFITGPLVIEKVLHQKITKDQLGGAQIHAQTSGVVHMVSPTEDICFEKLKQLLSYLPQNYLESTDILSLDNACSLPYFDHKSALSASVPEDKQKAYDIKNVIEASVDSASFFELQEIFARNIITGFARFDGIVVGIVANQPLVKAGTLDIDASCKAARFVRFCDAFSIPLITFVDTPGYLPGLDQEHNGIIRHGAKLLFAYAQATTPKITITLRKAYGGAYIVMASKHLGGDFNFAWPESEIAVMGYKGAVEILHKSELSALQPTQQKIVRAEREQEYQATYLNPFTAAEYGYIDAIIAPSQTREAIIRALKITAKKVETIPKKKHSTMPL